MKTAKFVRNLTGFRGDARLYKVEPAVEFGYYETEDKGKPTTNFVVVSEVRNSEGLLGLLHETYIFPSNESGEILNLGELDGSVKDCPGHDTVLRDAGFSVL